jgi:uncharacterized RDD family membrane protein YckC
VDYEDRIGISTPEGVEINYVLAGLGSRSLAQLLDLLIKAALVAVAILVAAAATPNTAIRAIVAATFGFAALFVYDVAFEVWSDGATPGKRVNGLRVVAEDGRAVSLAASAVRRLLWLVDVGASVGIVGAIAIVVTDRNQRLGDLAAGTVVVREASRGAGASLAAIAAAAEARAQRLDTSLQGPAAQLPAIDVTAITAAEIGAIRDFLARRSSLPTGARARVADRLVAAVGGKVGGLPPEGLRGEPLLEAIAAAKR